MEEPKLNCNFFNFYINREMGYTIDWIKIFRRNSNVINNRYNIVIK